MTVAIKLQLTCLHQYKVYYRNADYSLNCVQLIIQITYLKSQVLH